MRRPRLHFDIGAEDQSGRAFSSLQNSLDASQRSVVAMRSQFLAATAVTTAFWGAVTAAAARGASEIDEAAKAARRLESSIAGYRAAQLAAGELGVSLSGLTNDLQTMNRELARNSAGAQRSLETLGLAASDLAGLDADQQLAVLADRIHALGLGADQASVILQGLGIRNREMVLAVTAGGDVFRRARADVEDYGLALSDVDASRIEEANDRIGRLGLISQYAGQQLALALIPRFGELAEAMTDSLREGGLLRAMIDGLVNNVELLGQALVVLTAAAGTRYVAAMIAATTHTNLLTAALVRARAAVIALGGPMGILWGLLGGAAAYFLLFRDNADEVPPTLDSVREAQDLLNTAMGAFAAGAPGAGAEAIAYARNLEQTALAAIAAAEAIIAFNEARLQGVSEEALEMLRAQPGWETNPMRGILEQSAQAREQIDASRLALEQARETIRELEIAGHSAGDTLRDALDLDPIVIETTVAIEGLETALRGAGGAARDASDAVDDITRAMEEAQKAQESWAQTMAGHFDGLITGGKNLSGVLQSIARQLESQGWQMLFSAFGAGGKGGGGGGFFSGIMGWLSGARADGGPVSAGRTYLVGERGPELFTPSSSGQIVPNEKLGGAAQQVVVTLDLRSDMLDARISEGAGKVVIRRTPQIVNQSVQATHASFGEFKPA